MEEDLIDIYDRKVLCEYRDEKYIVRDNGAVFRLKREGKKKRPLDEKWTFGKPDKQKGYLNFSSEVAHRIVATAFKGKAPSKSHVVDHIDTNKKNNRPENLRWVTRLENILLNPITLQRVINLYGSIDNFLENPSKPIYEQIDSNFEWMRTVTKEEAVNSRKRLESWAKKGEIPKGGWLGDWVFNSIKKDVEEIENEFIQSLTSNAIQKNWKTQSEFPNCPTNIVENVLQKYQKKLVKGAVFSRNRYGDSIVEWVDITPDLASLIVLTSNTSAKPWSLAKVFINEDLFIHESLGTFLSLNGAKKQFTINLGLEWNGEDSIDDYM